MVAKFAIQLAISGAESVGFFMAPDYDTAR